MHPNLLLVEPVSEATGFEPYIPAHDQLRELTPLPLIVGTLLGIIFGASSLYLVLKVGLTVSASIPVAVISITLFRLLSKLGGRDATILENNIVQTAGSAGESIAFGVGVTMPAIMILGFDLEMTRVDAGRGARRAARHPDDDPAAPGADRAAARHAEVSRRHRVRRGAEGGRVGRIAGRGVAVGAGASRRSSAAAATSAATIFTGFGIGFVYKALNVAFKGWKDVPEKIFGAPFAGGSVSVEISPELLGVGYIIGPLHRLDHVRRRRAGVPRAHPGDQVLRPSAGRRRSRPARCRSPT